MTAKKMMELADRIAKAWRWEHRTSNGQFIESLTVNDQEEIVAALRASAREALEPFIKAAKIIADRPQDYSDRIVAIGGLATTADLHKRHFAALLALQSKPVPPSKPFRNRFDADGSGSRHCGLPSRPS